MRISGGIAKGRKIGSKSLLSKKEGKEYRLRPTSAKVREALFNILREKIDGAIFLDLYAGTGTVGFEALSRGAKKTIFVENNLQRIDVMRKVAEKLNFTERCYIVKSNAEDFILRADSNKDLFDIIFLDPPYQTDILENILNIIAEKNVIFDDGFIIAEHFKKKVLPEKIGNLRIIKTYRYGDTMLTFYKKGDA